MWDDVCQLTAIFPLSMFWWDKQILSSVNKQFLENVVCTLSAFAYLLWVILCSDESINLQTVAWFLRMKHKQTQLLAYADTYLKSLSSSRCFQIFVSLCQLQNTPRLSLRLIYLIAGDKSVKNTCKCNWITRRHLSFVLRTIAQPAEWLNYGCVGRYRLKILLRITLCFMVLLEIKESMEIGPGVLCVSTVCLNVLRSSRLDQKKEVFGIVRLVL